jgi:hypothetical protein
LINWCNQSLRNQLTGRGASLGEGEFIEALNNEELDEGLILMLKVYKQIEGIKDKFKQTELSMIASFIGLAAIKLRHSVRIRLLRNTIGVM